MARWTYKWLLNDCKSGNHRPTESVAEIVARCKQLIVDDETPYGVNTVQSRAGQPLSAFAPLLTSEIVPSAEDSVVGAWERMHLFWRYEALDFKVYFERQAELVAEKLSGKNRGRLRIGVFECQRFNQLLMTMAIAEVLDESEAAQWFAEKCFFLMADETGLYARKELCAVGPVEPFMVHLLCKWKGLSCELEIPNTPNSQVFRDLLSNWSYDIAKEVNSLLELHAHKVRNALRPNNDLVFGLQCGLNFSLPFEVYFLIKVRQQLGLSIPRLLHPIVQIPLAKKPLETCKSGFDPLIQLVLDRCQRIMPNLEVPWESTNQNRPATQWQLRWSGTHL